MKLALVAASLTLTMCGQDRGIVDEVNRLRSNPAKYAELLEKRLQYYSGQMLVLPGRVPMKTREGAKAVREAIEFLKKTPDRPKLEDARDIERAALDHVRDIGPKGLVQHKGSDRTDPADRVARRGRDRVAIGEVISFGPEQARDVVIDLVVDDGVEDRGHRKILLDPSFRYAGAACGPHKVYGTMCVIDFAGPRRAASRLR